MTAWQSLEGPAVRIILDSSLWCERHKRPYAPAWPAGFSEGTIGLFRAAVAMDAVIAWCHGDPARVSEALYRFAPLCCFISQGDLLAIYAQTVPAPPE